MSEPPKTGQKQVAGTVHGNQFVVADAIRETERSISSVPGEAGVGDVAFG